jgi:thioredoxin 1
MKPVQLFILKSCPYCRSALAWMDELKKENPHYASIDINIIDEGEHPEIADNYDYYYVPTYYIDGTKVHEGAASKEIVKSVFDKALE